MVTVKKTPAKAPAKVAPVKRRTPKPKAEQTINVSVAAPAPAPKPEAKKDDSTVGKIIGLIEWVDNPFKLFTVILLSFLFFAGYFAWDSRQVILNAITNSSHQPELKEIKVLEHVAQKLQKDLEAETVLVHKVNLVVNSRTTLLAYGPKSREVTLDGYNSTLFGKDPARNAAVIAMMNGEVYCDKLVATGKTSDWEEKQGVTFICRGSIPPEMGAFEGYISVGFTKEPQDLGAVKTRINLASTEMAK
jgi:hypothetical protein